MFNEVICTKPGRWSVRYLCLRGIDFVSFLYDFSVELFQQCAIFAFLLYCVIFLLRNYLPNNMYVVTRNIYPTFLGQLVVSELKSYQTYFNRRCPILDCPKLYKLPSRCKMPTLYTFNGRRCRGCYRNLCASYILPADSKSMLRK